MSEFQNEEQQSGLNINDILFSLFRRKWMIVLCATLGISAAAAVYFLLPPIYESESKLLVKYVVDRSTIDAVDGTVKTPGSPGESAIASEIEILTSWDLAMQVADAIGVQRLAPGYKGEANVAIAAGKLLKGLTVTTPPQTNIISVAYKNADPKLAIQVLQELITRYFDKHLEVHRSAGAIDFVARETDQLRTRLNQTDTELKQLKAKAGITSLAESTASLNTGMVNAQQELDGAMAELAEQTARVKELEKWEAGADAKQAQNAGRVPGNDAVQDYQSLLGRIAHLRESETQLLSKYTSENRLVKVTQAQIANLDAQRRDLEEKFPGLASLVPTAGSAQVARPDLISERARLVAVQARADALRSRLAGLQDHAKVIADLGPKISELERLKDVQETNYKYFDARLEKARIDETLDPTRMPNISIVQKPSPAVKATRDVKKIVLGLAVGGPGLGIAIALLIELVLDRTVKRPLELETRLRIPLLLSIPYFDRDLHSRLRLSNGRDDESLRSFDETDTLNVMPGEIDDLIQPFCTALRDHLLFQFEFNNQAHQSKLIGVTSLAKGAGASTLATGLANSLSETCDGNVLLVDKQFDPRRFYDLLSEFRASDFRYIVFDMPSLSQHGPTVAMGAYMDKVVLVVEAQKSDRDAVKRAYAQLAAANANVSTVFNKSRKTPFA